LSMFRLRSNLLYVFVIGIYDTYLDLNL
jgi:hypothetical protein